MTWCLSRFSSQTVLLLSGFSRNFDLLVIFLHPLPLAVLICSFVLISHFVGWGSLFRALQQSSLSLARLAI